MSLGMPHLDGRISRFHWETLVVRTDAAWEHLLVINVALNPGHQMLNVFGSRHLGRPAEVL